MSNERTHHESDKRVIRTKIALRTSLFSLLEKKSLSEITVKELTEISGVNRSTFYSYYADIPDMVRQIQNEIFEVFEKDVLSADVKLLSIDDFTRYIEKFLVFIKKHSDNCRFVISNDVENVLSTRIKTALLKKVPDTKKLFSENNVKRYITVYGVSGIWQTILEWMYDGMLIPPEEFAEFLSKVYFFGGRTVVLDKISFTD